jgi:hypothetical protein
MNGARDLACRRVRQHFRAKAIVCRRPPRNISFVRQERRPREPAKHLCAAFRLPSFLLVERDRADDDEPLY